MMCDPFKDPNMSSKFAEIGSEFWIENVPERLLRECDGVYAISGRTAIDLILQDVLKKKPIRSALMPAWCCDSMLAPFLDRNIDVRFYDVILGTQITTNEHELSIKYSLSNPDLADGTDILYLTNYFGYENTLPLEKVKRYKEQGSNILYDRTHSFLMDDEEYCKVLRFIFRSRYIIEEKGLISALPLRYFRYRSVPDFNCDIGIPYDTPVMRDDEDKTVL